MAKLAKERKKKKNNDLDFETHYLKLRNQKNKKIKRGDSNLIFPFRFIYFILSLDKKYFFFVQTRVENGKFK